MGIMGSRDTNPVDHQLVNDFYLFLFIDAPIIILLTPNYENVIETFFKGENEILRLIKQKVLDIEDLRRFSVDKKRIKRNTASKNIEIIESFEDLIRSINKIVPDCTIRTLIKAMESLNIGVDEIQTLTKMFSYALI